MKGHRDDNSGAFIIVRDLERAHYRAGQRRESETKEV